MRAGLKFLMIALGLFLIGIAVLLVLLAGPLEKLARAQVETRLGEIYGTKVSIGRARFSATPIALTVEDIVVYNPPGFVESPALNCKTLILLPDLPTLLTEHPRLRTIRREGVEMHLRHELGEGTNIGKLSNAAETFAAARQAEETEAQPQAEAAPPTPAAPAKRRLAVDKIECAGARLNLSASLVPLSSAALDIEPFTVELEEGAVSVPKVAGIILRSLVKKSVTVNGLLRPLSELLQEELSKETI